MIKNKNPVDIPILTPEALKTLQELQNLQNEGGDIEPQIQKAMSALKLASNIVNSAMSGKHIDLAYFKLICDLTTKTLQGNEASSQPRKLKKKKKLYRSTIPDSDKNFKIESK